MLKCSDAYYFRTITHTVSGDKINGAKCWYLLNIEGKSMGIHCTVHIFCTSGHFQNTEFDFTTLCLAKWFEGGKVFKDYLLTNFIDKSHLVGNT